MHKMERLKLSQGSVTSIQKGFCLFLPAELSWYSRMMFTDFVICVKNNYYETTVSHKTVRRKNIERFC